MKFGGSRFDVRSRLALTTALAGIFLSGYGYRRAHAGGCYSIGGGAYLCSGTVDATTDVKQTLAAAPLTVTTNPGFGIDTTVNFGSAFTLTGTGGLTFTDNNHALIRGYTHGIDATNNGSGALSITATGTVNGTHNVGIRASNFGTDLTIFASNAYGGQEGIEARNFGSGALSISATGTVEGSYSFGIRAYNFGTDLNISANNAYGGFDGVKALNFGSGALSIAVTGTADGDRFNGIYGYNAGSDLIISANNAYGDRYGIKALNFGSGALSIAVTGAAAGTVLDGIQARNYYGTDLIINAVDVRGGRNGVRALNTGSGSTFIGTYGAVEGGTGAGIATYSNAGMMTYVTVNASVEATVSGVAITNNQGDSDILVNPGGNVIGDVLLGDGSDRLSFFGATDFSQIGILDGGDDTSSADGWIDVLALTASSGSIGSGQILNWERIGLASSAITVTGDFTAPEMLSILGGSTLNITGNFAGGGQVNMADGIAGDHLYVGGNFTGANVIAVDADFDTATADVVTIGGTVSGGPSTLAVTGFGISDGSDILVVDVSGGSTSAGDFTLASPFVGAYIVDLELIGSQWFLTNPRLTVAAAIYEAYPQVLGQMNGLPTLAQRVGGRFFDTVGVGVTTNGSSPAMTDPPAAWQAGSPAGRHAVWTRLSGSRSHLEPESTSGTGIDLDHWQVQAGADALIVEGSNGRLFGGVTAHYGTVNADVFYSVGNGSIDTEGYGFGLTATFIGNGGFYADGQAQWSRFDSDLRAANFGQMANGNEGSGTALSLEIGRRIDNANGLAVTPQAQLAYSSVDFDSFTDPWGNAVQLADGESLALRTGISAERVQVNADGTSSRGHVIANVKHEFLDGTRVKVANTQLRSVPDRWTGEIGLGGSHEWAPGFSIHGEASLSTGLENLGDSYAVKGTLGISVSF